MEKSKDNAPLHVSWNQDFQCFACGTEQGFRVFNSDPLKERFRRDFSDGGIGIVEMLFRCNILALVGGGSKPKYPPTKVMLWDDLKAKAIVELEYVTNVKAVKLRRDRIAVVLEHHVYVYDLKYLKKLHQYETYPNPKGLAALCPNSTNSVLAFPGLQQGHVHIELYDQKKQTIIDAHDGPLSALALNLDGTRLATASEKGTLLRIFDTQSGDLLQELRRGADRAEINNLAFNSNSTWLACSSDKGTIHVFALGEAVSNPKSTLSFMKDFLPKYFSSEWSLAQFHVPDSRSICAFGAEAHSIIVVCSDGSYYKAVFDPKAGGEMRQVSYDRFIAADPHAPGAGGVAVSTGGVLGGDMNEVGGVSRDAVNTSTETATTAGGAHDATLTVGASSTAATEGGMTGGSTSTVGGGMDNDANLDIVGPGASESGPQAIREA